MSFLDFTVDDLCENIPGENECGEDPRSDISPSSTYYTLKDVRNNARANERKALIDEESLASVVAEWNPILEQVPDALINNCKDIELTAWYIEALTRKHGFKGLTFGFQLAKNLIESYWDGIYPTPDDGDLSERIAPLAGLNGVDGPGSLITPIKSILITNGIDAYSTWQYEQACEIDRLDSDKKEKKIANGAISLSDVEQSIKETDKSFFIELSTDIESAIQAFTLLSNAMDNAMQGDPQPTSYIRKALESCSLAIKHLTKDILVEESVEEPVLDEDIQISEEQAIPKSNLNQLVETREQALDKLEEIAKFFRKTEPHSPMSYAIEQVVRWSELSLPELLQELIADGDARNGFFKLSGIKTDTDTK